MADHSVAADLSGEATLTGNISGAHQALAADLSGSASLSSDLTGSVPVTVDFSGDASLTATDSTSVPVAADLSGDAALTGGLEATWSVEADLSGESSFRAMGSTSLSIASNLSGDASLTGAAGVPRYSINSMTFDGSDEYVTMGDVLDFDNATGDAFTVSAWVKTTDTAGYILAKMDNTPVGYGFSPDSSGRPLLTLINNLVGSNRIDVYANSSINDGEWHHICASYDGSQSASGVAIYIDGSAQATTTTNNTLGTRTTVTSAEFNINGRTSGGAFLLAAAIDEVSIWDKELSASEVAEVYNNGNPASLALHSVAANLVGWWRMGERSSFPTIPDQSGNDYDGTATNMESADITSDTPWAWLVEADLSGEATFTATDSTTVPITTDLSGDASLSSDLTASVPVEAALSGDAVQAADLTGTVPVSGAFSGDAVLTSTMVADWVVASALTGEAILTAATTGETNVEASLSGDASLTATDSTTVPVDASLSGDATLTSEVTVKATIFSTKSIVFDGASQYVTMGDVLGFERTDAFSISLWFRTTDAGYILSKMDSTPRGYGIGLGSPGVSAHLVNSGTIKLEVRTTASFEDGAWHHALIVFDGTGVLGGITIYVDGASQALTIISNSLSTNTILSSGSFNLNGRMNGAAYLLAATIDEVSIWNKELSAAEVTEAYHGGLPADLAQHSASANLLAWWRMGEDMTFPTIPDLGLGTFPYPDVIDFAGSNDGTMINMESGDLDADAPYGKCVEFDGSNDYVTMGDVLGFERTDSFSVAFWFKITSSAGNDYVIGKMNGWSPYVGWAFSMGSGGELRVEIINNYSTGDYIKRSTSSTYNDGQWHFACWTYDGSSSADGALVYVDGVAASLTTNKDSLTSSILNSTALNVGSYGNGFQVWNGSIDEVTVWNKILSQAEVEELYNGGRLPVDPTETSMVANLAAWWPMGQKDVYPTLQDQSGNGLDGTMTSMTSMDIVDRLVDSALAFSKKSLVFDGVNEYVDMGTDVLLLERTDAFSISIWYKDESTSGNSHLLSKMATGGLNYIGYTVQMRSDTGKIRFYLISNYTPNYLQVETTRSLEHENRWRHIVITYDGSSTAAGVTFYIDGDYDPSTGIVDNLTGSIVSTSTNFNLGMRDNTNEGWDGNLDEITIWDKELSASEVEALYNWGVPESQEGSPDLLAYWHLGDDVPNPGTMVNMTAGDIVNDAPGAAIVEADLSGEATFGADLTGDVPVAAAMSGDATFVADVIFAVFVEAAFSGDATLADADLERERALDAPLSGDATLDATMVGDVPVDAPLSGEATLSGTLGVLREVDASLSGDADLQATLEYLTITLLETVGLSEASWVGQTHQVVSTMAGDAAFSASPTVQGDLQATLQGEATFVATAEKDLEASLSGEATVAADLMAVTPVEANLLGEASLSAGLDAVVPVGASFSGEAVLDAAVGVHTDLDKQMTGMALLWARLSISKGRAPSDATVVPKRSPQESAYQIKHYSIQDRRR